MINGKHSKYGKFLPSISSLLFAALTLGPACNEPHKDWDNPGGESLYKQYGGVRPSGDKQGVPFFAVLTPAGASLGDARLNGDNIGYPSDPASAAFFLKTLKAAAPDMTDAEMATLKTGLQRNAKI